MSYQHIHYLDQVRAQNPLVHNITNLVSAHFSANGLLAIGASPIMSGVGEEMEQLAQINSALAINLGTPTPEQVVAMKRAAHAMHQLGKPVVLDPVGVGATKYRQETTLALLDEIHVNLIRGNAGEIAFLAGVEWQSKGVDAGSGDADNLGAIAKACANKYHCVVALSGKTDYISDGKQVIAIHNGTPLFPKITASGCLLAAICAAFLAVADDDLVATVDAVLTYAIAGELAAKPLKPTQTGTFYTQLIDTLGAITHADIAKYANIEVVSDV